MTSESIFNNLEQLQARALEELEVAKSSEETDQWRIAYMGRKGALTQILRSLGELDPVHRKEIGSAANNLKNLFESRLAEVEETIRTQKFAVLTDQRGIDITMQGRSNPIGRLHPTTQILREISSAFVSMGFQVMEGPEVEWDHYNFEMLNIPKGHPARDMWNTLWEDYTDDKGEQNMLLRTHTSPMQGRIMEKTQPPIRVVIPGKCYRYEATDATHEWQFHQIEGLAVDKNISFSELKGTLFEMARKLFGSDQKVRFRCDFFPFVEPGVDMSIEWNGKWIEILGAGMVHPKVLEGVGYNPQEYSGFAFGLGPERISICLLYTSDAADE